MASITVNKISTTDNTPIITGTVEMDRFDLDGTAKQSINVTVNYKTYTLFGGNLGLDETTTPKTWKLHITSPLYPGTYNVIAEVIDLQYNRIIASDTTTDELIINRPTPQQVQNQNLSLLQKYLAVNALMNTLNTSFGGQNGLTPLPSVHPVQDDQSSTALTARDGSEGSQHPIRKDKDARRVKGVPLPPKKSDFAATGQAGGGGGPSFELIQGSDVAEELGEIAQMQGAEQDDPSGDVRPAETQAPESTVSPSNVLGVDTGNQPFGTTFGMIGA